MQYFPVETRMYFNSLVTTPIAVGQLGVVATIFLVKAFHMFSTDTPLTAIHLAQVVTVLLGAFAATVYFEEKSHAAFCQIKNLREDLDVAQAKHSSVVDDLNKTAEKKLANTEMNLYYTRKGLEDAETALEQTRKIASAHFEFREALAKELTRTRAQRDWATGGMRYCTDTLEARRKASSQELVAWEMQSQIKFKANELRDMTLSLENIKKELALANKFSQEAQDEIDEQHVKIEEHEKLIEKKEKVILGLLEQIRGHKLGCRRMHSTIERSNLGADSVITKLENMNEDLTREVENWRGMSQHWSSNNANTIHAMGSEINELRGELAELDAENERLTRDLKAMVEHVESFDKEREAMINQIEQLEWNVVVPEVSKKEEKDFTEELDNSTNGEGDEKEDASWFPDGDSEDDGTAYELDEVSEEEESEWFHHAPTDAKDLPHKQVREDALKMRVMLNAESKDSDEWCAEVATLVNDDSKSEDLDVDNPVNSGSEYEDNDLYDSLYSEDEILATSRIEEEDKDMVSVPSWG